MQVNKPYLPLASGEFSMRTAAAVVVATGAAALALGAAAASAPLMATLAGSLALGVAYSTDLPGLRWKQHPLAAAACILAVRCARTTPAHAQALGPRAPNSFGMRTSFLCPQSRLALRDVFMRTTYPRLVPGPVYSTDTGCKCEQ